MSSARLRYRQLARLNLPLLCCLPIAAVTGHHLLELVDLAAPETSLHMWMTILGFRTIEFLGIVQAFIYLANFWVPSFIRTRFTIVIIIVIVLAAICYYSVNTVGVYRRYHAAVANNEIAFEIP